MTFRFSPVRVDDATAWAQLISEAEVVDQTGEYYSAEDLTEEIESPMMDLEHGTRAVWDGEHLVAVAILHLGTSGEPYHRIFFDALVHPAYRRQGVGAQLVEWAVRVAPDLHAARFPGAPLQLHAEAAELNTDKGKLLARAGFAERRYFFTMVRDLHTDVTPPAPVDGVRVAPFDFAYDEATLELRNTTFADHWGFTPMSAESWKQWATGTRTFRPDLSYHAFDAAGVPVSFLLAHYFDANTEATGKREAYIGTIGTVRDWRRKGVASMLIARCLTDAKAQGYDEASLGVDADSPTGAVGVYEAAGFTVKQRRSRWVLEF
ncbi:GNAT family N-acetyltransferase [Hamadaea tsunoensis]|uniref:GNAT family N-acetyltransferase n=1 Tax=Hamadaea tsunoensis TaxID=53368 RepID=UPI0004158566|nr:GNAT family N-acetyltransferase [Hamadaea tsunoensis]